MNGHSKLDGHQNFEKDKQKHSISKWHHNELQLQDDASLLRYRHKYEVLPSLSYSELRWNAQAQMQGSFTKKLMFLF